jgi:hypothetical protein
MKRESIIKDISSFDEEITLSLKEKWFLMHIFIKFQVKENEDRFTSITEID